MSQEQKNISFLQDLFNRHFFRYIGSYLAVSFGILEFCQFIEKRYELDVMLVEKSFLFLIILLPAFVLFVYNHGRPQKEKWLPYERIILPISISLAVILSLLFFNNPKLAATEFVSITNEEGETLTRVVPTVDFTKRLVIFPFENNSNDTSLNWLIAGGSYLLDKDLEQDVRIYSTQALSMKYYYDSYKHEYLSPLPFATKVKIAQDYYSDHFIVSSFEKQDNGFTLRSKVYNSDNGQEIYSLEVQGKDFFEMIDNMTVRLSQHLYTIESGSAFELIDLPVSNLTSTNPDAVKNYIEGYLLRIRNVQNLNPAIQKLENSILLDPKCAECYSALSELYFSVGAIAKSREYIEKATDLADVLPERQKLNMRTFEYQVNDQLDKSLYLLENWRKLYPNDLTPYTHLINFYELTFEIDKAKQIGLDALAKGHKGALLTKLARLYTKTEEYDEAEKYLNQFAELYPHKAKERALLGDIYISKGELSKARNLYEELLLLDPKDHENLTKLGKLEERLGNFEEALAIFHKVLRDGDKVQDSIDIYEAITELYERQGQYSKVFETIRIREQLFEKLIPIPSVRQLILFTAGQKWVFGGKPEEFQRRSSELMKLIPDRAELLSCIADFQFYLFTENLEGIMSLSDECTANLLTNSGNSFSYLLDGAKARLTGNYEQAIQLYEMYLDSSGTSARQLGFDLSKVYRLNGNLNKAEELVNKLLKEDPAQPAYLLEMSKISLAKGDQSDAKKLLVHALEIWKYADSEGKFYKEALEFKQELEKSD